MRILRWKAIAPLSLFAAATAVGWYFLLDEVARRSIEAVGTSIVGAKVDLEEADIRLRDGSVTLRGLQVTNPDAPMSNLIQLDEMVASVRLGPLLGKKIFVDTAAVRGVRFGTPRASSGAVENPDPQSAALRRRLREWADRVPIPEFSLSGLTGAVNVGAIRPENLETPALANGIRGAADSSRQLWQSQLQSLDPAPVIDSARALANRLSGASLISLGLQGAVRSVQSVQSTLGQISEKRSGIGQLAQAVTGGATELRRQVESLAAARARDLASARNLLNVPSLDAPDISPALFGDIALARIQPILYWAQTAERYLPPGLDPRRRPGPKRARMSGTVVDFPAEHGYAGLTIGFAELAMVLGGEGASAGEYAVRINDFSSAPSVHGSPIQIAASRVGASSGPQAVRLTAVLDHVTQELRDSLDVQLDGVSLPTITLPGLGATLNLGTGRNAISLVRAGDSVRGRMLLSSRSVTWDRGGLGSGRVNDIVWRTLSGLTNVDVEVQITGSIHGPRLAVRSNVASEISRSLRNALGDEVREAERRVRAEVERLVAQPIADARSEVDNVVSTAQSAVAGHQQRLDEVKAELEARLTELRRLIPGR